MSPRKPYVRPSTGHPLSDAMVPAALAFVDAVHTGDHGAALDATAQARAAVGDNPYWPWVWSLTLAALVPQDARLSELLAWTREAA